MDNQSDPQPSFFARLGTAFACFFRALGDAGFCRDAGKLLNGPAPQAESKPKPAAAPVELPPERVHASGLLVFSMLQREGRFIDFLKEDVAAFSDADVGAAARVVHAGCRKVLDQALDLEPVLKDAEGASVTVPAGFDAQRIRVTGNVAGNPPFHGSLKHHGWAASAVRLPSVASTLDPRVLAPAEVELS
jgi:hypothetical protein